MFNYQIGTPLLTNVRWSVLTKRKDTCSLPTRSVLSVSEKQDSGKVSESTKGMIL